MQHPTCRTVLMSTFSDNTTFTRSLQQPIQGTMMILVDFRIRWMGRPTHVEVPRRVVRSQLSFLGLCFRRFHNGNVRDEIDDNEDHEEDGGGIAIHGFGVVLCVVVVARVQVLVGNIRIVEKIHQPRTVFSFFGYPNLTQLHNFRPTKLNFKISKWYVSKQNYLNGLSCGTVYS